MSLRPIVCSRASLRQLHYGLFLIKTTRRVAGLDARNLLVAEQVSGRLLAVSAMGQFQAPVGEVRPADPGLIDQLDHLTHDDRRQLRRLLEANQ